MAADHRGGRPARASVRATSWPSLPSPTTTTRSPGPIAHLLLHLERGGQRLREDGDLVGHAVGHRVQVRDRQRQELGEGAVAAADAEDGPRRAVRAPARPAGRARAAARVDLADHPAADPFRRGGRPIDLAHELVAGDARERVVALARARGRCCRCRPGARAPAPRPAGGAGRGDVAARAEDADPRATARASPSADASARAFFRAASNSSPGLPGGQRGRVGHLQPRGRRELRVLDRARRSPSPARSSSEGWW